jgi:hypothetical protein
MCSEQKEASGLSPEAFMCRLPSVELSFLTVNGFSEHFPLPIQSHLRPIRSKPVGPIQRETSLFFTMHALNKDISVNNAKFYVPMFTRSFSHLFILLRALSRPAPG